MDIPSGTTFQPLNFLKFRCFFNDALSADTRVLYCPETADEFSVFEMAHMLLAAYTTKKMFGDDTRIERDAHGLFFSTFSRICRLNFGEDIVEAGL